MEEDPQPHYIHQFPFRFVEPYPYTYRTFTKGRWIGKPLLPTLVKQFKAYPPQYYENAIQTGKITVRGKQVLPDYVLKNGDQISHVSLRVQPPVLDLPLEIVEETDELLAINKPPSLIVHTGGGHHYNTVQSLLKYEHHFTNLHILHRLDKCTSGLLLFAKDKKIVAQFHEESGKETMKKMYFARVGGNFKWEEKTLSAYIECVSHKDGVYRVTEEIIDDVEPQKQEEKVHKEKEGMKQEAKVVKNKKKEGNEDKQQKKDLKDSKTLFKKVWYDQDTDSSLLQCYPITGRTHQIRVHLKFLGYPILNDTDYGGKFVGNRVIENIRRKEEEETEDIIKKKVKLCEQLKVEGWDFKTKSWQIMLHSFKYRFGGREFKTEVPYWFCKQKLNINIRLA